MKKLFMLAAMMLMALTSIFAQNVTKVTFTGERQDKSHQKLDSVLVTNLTQDWSEVVYYPDTLILLSNVGITDYESRNGKVHLYQNIPNPFHGVTNFNLTLADKEKVDLVIYDISGRKVAEYHNTLPGGEHQFRTSMDIPQTYLLSAVTKSGTTSIKMINLSNTGEQARIELISSLPLASDFVKKESVHGFKVGDEMQYVGYATQNTGVKDATITKAQNESETITFTFPNEKPVITVLTDSASNVNDASATLYGSYEVKLAEVTVVGFEYWKSKDSKVTSVDCKTVESPFSVAIQGLIPNTEYTYCAYVKTMADSLVRGTENTFTTKVAMPEVQTGAVDNVGYTSANVTSKLVSDGGSVNLLVGVRVYNEELKFDSLYVTKNLNGGVFVTAVSGLEENTPYSVKAYAKNEAGEVYGEEVSFTTDKHFECGDSFSDVEGNKYKTVKIGEQCWMRDNLRVKKYSDGKAIEQGDYKNMSYNVGYWYYPDGTLASVSTYGLIYNWTAVMRGASSNNSTPSGVQGICPKGWHVPSYAEWKKMTGYVGSQSQYYCSSKATNIAKALASTSEWKSNNTTCTPGNNPGDNNATGLSILPSGYCYYGGNDDLGYSAFVWSTTEQWGGYPYCLDMKHNLATVNFNSQSTSQGAAVRCVWDN